MKLSHLILSGLMVTSGSVVRGESQNLPNCIELRLTIERTDETSSTDWAKVAEIASDMITIFKTLENNGDDTTWLETFGSPFKEWYQIASNKTGIHGNISLMAGDKQDESEDLKGQPQDFNTASKIGIKISMYHEKEFDQTAYNKIFADSVMFIEQVRNNRQAIKGLGVPLQLIINMEHARKDLSLSLKDDSYDKLILGFKDKK